MSSLQLIEHLPVGWQNFAKGFCDWPELAVASAVEILLVMRGAKPAVRVIVPAKDVSEMIGFLGYKGLTSLIRLDPRGDQMQFELVAFRDRSIATQIATCFALPPRENYVKFGELLGYPACCIAFAARAEFRTRQNPQFRKANLIEMARRRSQSFKWQLNSMLRESVLSQVGPVALVSHYPCRFDCRDSLALANRYLAYLGNIFEDAELALKSILSLKVSSWQGIDWEAPFDAEQCGIVYFSMRHGSGFIALSRRATPMGTIPESGILIDERFLVAMADTLEKCSTFDLHAPGSPVGFRFQ